MSRCPCGGRVGCYGTCERPDPEPTGAHENPCFFCETEIEDAPQVMVRGLRGEAGPIFAAHAECVS